MTQLITTIPEAWLQTQKIENYELVTHQNNSDIVVNVNESVDLACKID